MEEFDALVEGMNEAGIIALLLEFIVEEKDLGDELVEFIKNGD